MTDAKEGERATQQDHSGSEWKPDPGTMKVRDLPRLYATNFVLSMGNDVTVILQAPEVMTMDGPDGGGPIETVVVRSTGVVSMSLQAAKDLVHLLASNIAGYEAEVGPIETPWLKGQRDAQP